MSGPPPFFTGHGIHTSLAEPRTDRAVNIGAFAGLHFHRLLDPDSDSVTLNTLFKAATAIGRKIHLELV